MPSQKRAFSLMQALEGDYNRCLVRSFFNEISRQPEFYR
jgi:hypothetical protein